MTEAGGALDGGGADDGGAVDAGALGGAELGETTGVGGGAMASASSSACKGPSSAIIITRRPAPTR